MEILNIIQQCKTYGPSKEKRKRFCTFGLKWLLPLQQIINGLLHLSFCSEVSQITIPLLIQQKPSRLHHPEQSLLILHHSFYSSFQSRVFISLHIWSYSLFYLAKPFKVRLTTPGVYVITFLEFFLKQICFFSCKFDFTQFKNQAGQS